MASLLIIMVVAVIVDIRLGCQSSQNEAASMFFEPVRTGLQNVLNLHCISEGKEHDLSLIVCRTHPDDCEKVLSPPYMLHTAYEAVQWLDNRLDSEIIGSSPIDSQRSIVNSFQSCIDDHLTHIVLLSCHYESVTLSTIARCVPKGVAFTFYPVCLRCNEDNDELQQFSIALQQVNHMHRVISIIPSPVAWEYVFSDIRELLLRPIKCILDLSALLKNRCNTTTEIMIRPCLERLVLPQTDKVCSCHGCTPDEIEPFNCYQAIQIGSQFFCMSNQAALSIGSDNFNLVGKCFIDIDDVCESKLSCPLFIGWQQKADESFVGLRRIMIRKKLALILERQESAIVAFTRRYLMTFTSETKHVRDEMESGFALVQELISKDQILVGWRMKTITEANIVPDENCNHSLHPLFSELSRDLSSILLHSSFHGDMRGIITASLPFKPKRNAA